MLITFVSKFMNFNAQIVLTIYIRIYQIIIEILKVNFQIHSETYLNSITNDS